LPLLLEADSITKSFAGVRALTRVTFTLAAGDLVRIEISEIGTLENSVVTV